VADQLATGRPNACNLCHLEKSLEWTANQLAAWFRHPVPELSQPQREWAESVRLGLAGDAGQRALIAWHWGWQPALEASAKGWLAPMLGALLDDPYAAIRCQAERSLRKSGLPVPNGYDFVPEPDSRPPVSNGLLDRWRTHLATNGTVAGSLPSTVVVQSTGGSLEEQLAPVLRLRDHRPMRLRE
jgi:hypothetical protein